MLRVFPVRYTENGATEKRVLLIATRPHYRAIINLVKVFQHIVWMSIMTLLCLPAQAQQHALTESMVEAFQQLDYDRAEAYAQEILASYNDFPLEDLTQVHTTLGMIRFAQNSQTDAKNQFEAALSLSPDLELDPTLVSPKILGFFNEIKSSLAQQNDVSTGESDVRYILLEDPRPAAAMRSLALPGWGQFYKGEQRKGVMMMGAWGMSASATLIAHLSRQEARSQYRKAKDPGEIASRYDRYNTRNKIRNGLALLTAGVWLYSYIDALSMPVQLSTPNREASLALRPAIMYPYTQLHFSVSF